MPGSGFRFEAREKIVWHKSDAWRRFAVDALGFLPSNVTVIRNWTATRELLEIGAKRVARRDAPVRLLFVGWLEREKGVFELIDACRQLAANREFTLDMVGEGNASTEARALVARHGLGGVIRFRGWLNEDRIHQELAAADVLVLPSWAEGLPNAMIEAMAARLAVVVTGVGAIPELIDDQRSGMLVEPRNADALARALDAILADGEFRDRLAQEAYRTALREFEIEAAVDRLVREIEGTIAAGREGRLSGRAL